MLQITAETAYDMMSPGPSVRHRPKVKGSKKRYAQPQDIREGMANAYMLVKEVSVWCISAVACAFFYFIRLKFERGRSETVPESEQYTTNIFEKF